MTVCLSTCFDIDAAVNAYSEYLLIPEYLVFFKIDFPCCVVFIFPRYCALICLECDDETNVKEIFL